MRSACPTAYAEPERWARSEVLLGQLVRLAVPAQTSQSQGGPRAPRHQVGVVEVAGDRGTGREVLVGGRLDVAVGREQLAEGVAGERPGVPLLGLERAQLLAGQRPRCDISPRASWHSRASASHSTVRCGSVVGVGRDGQGALGVSDVTSAQKLPCTTQVIGQRRRQKVGEHGETLRIQRGSGAGNRRNWPGWTSQVRPRKASSCRSAGTRLGDRERRREPDHPVVPVDDLSRHRQQLAGQLLGDPGLAGGGAADVPTVDSDLEGGGRDQHLAGQVCRRRR